MEKQLDHAQHLIRRHREMMDGMEINTEEFGNICYELENTWGLLPDAFGLYSLEQTPSDYAIYPILYDKTGKWHIEHLPTNHVWGVWTTYKEALEYFRNKMKEKKELDEKMKKAGAKFDEVAKKNSLDERYRDKVVEAPKKKVTPYLENLMKKAKERTEEMHASIEEWRMGRNWKLANAEYAEALLNH